MTTLYPSGPVCHNQSTARRDGAEGAGGEDEMANLDRQNATWSLLTLSDGRQFDVYGDTWADMKEEAAFLVDTYATGVEIVFNSESPE